MRYENCFMSGVLIALFLTFGFGTLSAQSLDGGSQGFADVYDRAYSEASVRMAQLQQDDGTLAEKKSGFLAVMYSLVLPGMGELYAERFDRGKYPLIAEAGLWLGLIGVNSYGNWVENDSRLFAISHAGIDVRGKEDEFFVNIENYSDLYDYNNQRLVERLIEEVYPDEAAWHWQWDTEENRLDYKDQRIRSDELHNAVTFFVLGMIANRVWSAIQAAISVKSYNAGLLERLGSLPEMNARMTSYAGRTDGVEVTFRW